MARSSATPLRTEVFAGITTFLTMSYIVFANPAILADAGAPAAAVQTATCLGAALACLLMAALADYPFALAPGMGLNAMLAYTVCRGLGASWQTGMAVVVVEGLLVTVLVLAGLRRWIMDALPASLKHAIGMGIGLFIALIGLKNAGWVVGQGATLVAFGDPRSPQAVVALVGLLVSLGLLAWRIHGALLWGIAAAAIAADAGYGLAAWPARIAAAPDFSTVGAFASGLSEAFSPRYAPVILAFMLSDFFDTMGTVIGVGAQAGFVDRRGDLPRLQRVLVADSLAAVLGGALGCSSVTTYVESASGVAAGGRRGATAVTVAALFGVAIFFNPLAGAVPACAVAPALILVGFLMMGSAARVRWDDLEEGLPAFLTLVLTPLTASIATGVGCGILAHLALQAVKGRARVVPPVLWVVGAVFAADFAWTPR